MATNDTPDLFEPAQKPEDSEKIDDSSDQDSEMDDQEVETPKSTHKSNNKKRRRSGSQGDSKSVEDLTDRDILLDIRSNVRNNVAQTKRVAKKTKVHAKAINVLKVNDEILNHEVQDLKNEAFACRKFFTNKILQLNRDINTMKYEESNVVIYDLKTSELKSLIKNDNVKAAVTKFGLQFIKRYIDTYKPEDFTAEILVQRNDGEDRNYDNNLKKALEGEHWRMLLKMASTHFAQLLMWRMKKRGHFNFRGGLSKMSRDQAQMIEDEVKRKNAALPNDSKHVYKRKHINKMALVDKEDPRKTIKFVEPFDPQPFAKPRITSGTKMVQHDEEGLELSEDEVTLGDSSVTLTEESTNVENDHDTQEADDGSASAKKRGRPRGSKNKITPNSSQSKKKEKNKKNPQKTGPKSSSSTQRLPKKNENKRKNLRDVIAEEKAKNAELQKQLRVLQESHTRTKTSSGGGTD